jgi:hypothetical protein
VAIPWSWVPFSVCEGDGALSHWEESSTARVVPPARPRKLAKVPFVELADGRLQGVVSSGSDIARVYVSSVAAGDYAFACTTNNNRPCGGARGSFCNHILALVNEAVLQYGGHRVARYLRIDVANAEQDGPGLAWAMDRTRPQAADSRTAAPVFSRFLRHLAYLELPAGSAPLPEMQWFPSIQEGAVSPEEPGSGVPQGSGPLTEPVAGLDEVLAAVAEFDRALVGGLLRPQPAQAAGLARLAAAVSGSPLAAKVAEAAEKAAAGVAGEDHFLVLAAARTALLGAGHDALLARADEATGRRREPESAGSGEAPQAASAAQAANLSAAARSWLADLARAGWQGIDHELISGTAPVVSAMLPDPALHRLATLLDGFAAELAACCPGAAQERFPERRWADLWSRALLLTQPGALGAAVVGTVTGRLLPLGVDLHEHATAGQAQVHAVLEPADGGPARLVRAGASVPKPDTVVGAGVWQLLRPHLSLLTALSEGRCVELAGMPVTAEGDLLWNEEQARLGEPADPFATARVALPTATASSTAPLDRHPALLAEPVFLEGYTVVQDAQGTAFVVAGQRLAVDADRAPAAGPLTPEAVAASSACIGLLRWDAGAFRVQPLAVETLVKKRTVGVHAGAWAGGTADKQGVKAEKAATEAVAVLRERAGRLLRA